MTKAFGLFLEFAVYWLVVFLLSAGALSLVGLQATPWAFFPPTIFVLLGLAAYHFLPREPDYPTQ